ncbi:hypothetical protein [Palleronia abyssalis]|uniref:Uncharacterized protein n=1 Tax=Palleronia abyssalis TaxID=1501240 RepID=A0A2R8BXZ0_9RHOB|nr:hypothetical protein [Palleronia abyssalis]SPJ25047.1 hypothetical protein PAA8504_02890 [Palleronia abyssalis]
MEDKIILAAHELVSETEAAEAPLDYAKLMRLGQDFTRMAEALASRPSPGPEFPFPSR